MDFIVAMPWSGTITRVIDAVGLHYDLHKGPFSLPVVLGRQAMLAQLGIARPEIWSIATG